MDVEKILTEGVVFKKASGPKPKEDKVKTKAKKKTYSLRTDADFKAVVLESYFDGMELKINRNNIFTYLVGKFNVSNLLAIYGAASLLGMSDDDLLKGVSKLQSAPGRFQVVQSEAGIVGMGGAAFPLHVKLMPPKDNPIDTVILNGAECEPYLTSDHRIMLETPEEIIMGLKILLEHLGILV